MPSHSLDVLAGLEPVVPAALAERAAAWGPGSVAAPAWPAASVVLLHPAAEGGLETYLLHRHARMPFAPSMVVFPGGRLDPTDLEEEGLAADAALRRCAVRETEEETGVRLGAPDLLPWAHWITPEPEPRRYDTAFYLAALPACQRAVDISGETDRAGWQRPSDALADAASGAIGLMPPTWSILLELAGVADLAAVRELAAGRVIETVLPELVRAGGGWQFRYPRAAASRGSR